MAAPRIALKSTPLVLVALLAGPLPAHAQVTHAQIEEAAAPLLEARADQVLACALDHPTLEVDVAFRPDGVVSGVDLGPGAPAEVTACVDGALSGLALPGAVPPGTVVQHVFHAQHGHGLGAPSPQATEPPAPEPSPPEPSPEASQGDDGLGPALFAGGDDAQQAPSDDGLGAGLFTAEGAPAQDDDARLDVGRYVVEVLVGGAVAAGVGYGAYAVLCGHGSDCFDAALGALGAEMLTAPLAIWGVGQAMGGRGDILFTYLGGTTAFAGMTRPEDPSLAVVMGAAVLPFASALMFELTSEMEARRSVEARGGPTHWRAGVAPLYGRAGLAGADLVLGGEF